MSSELNAEIARLMGYTVKRWEDVFDSAKNLHMGKGKWFLFGPDGRMVSRETRDTEAEAWKDAPAYDSDPAAALTLVDHVCKQAGVYRVEVAYESTTDKYRVVVDLWTHNVTARTNELPLSTAKACRDALTALRAAGQDGKETGS